MALQSASTILQSTQFWAFEEKTQKYIKHKFQDYAYRLALKLGDLHHKPIYMRLAKTVPHVLLEQALSFALDYRDEPNKGKLFMWKLKQLREEYDYKQSTKNFAQAHVAKTMAKFFDQFADELLQKHHQQFNSEYEQQLHLAAEWALEQYKKRNLRALVLQSGAALDNNFFANLGFKTTGYDISRVLVNRSKQRYPKLALKYKNDYSTIKSSATKYHLVWGYRLWNVVSQNAETLQLSILNRMCNPNALLVMNMTCHDDEETENWQELELGGQKYLYYQKLNNLQQLSERANATGWEVVRATPYLQSHVVWLKKVADVLPEPEPEVTTNLEEESD